MNGEDVNIKAIEDVSEEIGKRIDKGETKLEVFDPFIEKVNEVVEYLNKNFELKAVDEITDEELGDIKKVRTKINKVLEIIKDSRKKITGKLMEAKKEFDDKEKEIVKELSMKEESIKELLNDKKNYDEEQEILNAMPERKSEAVEMGLVFSEEEFNLNEKKFKELYDEKMEEKIKKARDEDVVREEIKSEIRQKLIVENGAMGGVELEDDDYAFQELRQVFNKTIAMFDKEDYADVKEWVGEIEGVLLKIQGQINK